MLIPPPLSLYVHIPWCVRKCPYCDFNSHQAGENIPEDAYIDALLADLETDLPRVWGRVVNTLFFGGGTPSLMSPAAIDRLLTGIRTRVTCAPDLEITLEANPGTVDEARFAGFRAAGVNRLSIGIQSFDDALLMSVGRIHDGAAAARAATAARSAGFDNFNLDLMFGLPGQTLDQALSDVRRAIALEPTHISHYELTLEPNTLFHHQPPTLPEDDLIGEMLDRCQEALSAAGYGRYEISAYARAGHECSHNLNYWRFGDYLGVGAGAHGKISDGASGAVRRTWKVRHPRAYLDAAPAGKALGGENEPDRDALITEFMMNALRITRGFDLATFEPRTGIARDAIDAALTQARERGLIVRDGQHVQASELGLRYLNDLVGLFIAEH